MRSVELIKPRAETSHPLTTIELGRDRALGQR
jgi:hypothetical protein